jgi:FXSXX-COOH protein
MSEDKIAMETELLDLSGLSPVDLKELDAFALVHMPRRVLADRNGSEDPITGFSRCV